MASYTEHYGLHQWVPEDDFLRTDFNTDFQKIDDALGEKSGVVCGTYSGNDADSQSIHLGFRPRAVLVLERIAMVGGGGGSYPILYGGLALTGAPVQFDSSRIAIQLTDSGFTVHHYSDFDYIRVNRSGQTYHYLAVR